MRSLEPSRGPASAISIPQIRWNGRVCNESTTISPISPLSPSVFLHEINVFRMLSSGSLVRHAELNASALRVVLLDAGTSHEGATEVTESPVASTRGGPSISALPVFVFKAPTTQETLHETSRLHTMTSAINPMSGETAPPERPIAGAPQAKASNNVASPEQVYSSSDATATHTGIVSSSDQRLSTPDSTTTRTAALRSSPRSTSQRLSVAGTAATTTPRAEAGASKVFVWGRLHMSYGRSVRSPSTSSGDDSMPPGSPRTPVYAMSLKGRLKFGSVSDTRSPLAVLAGSNSPRAILDVRHRADVASGKASTRGADTERTVGAGKGKAKTGGNEGKSAMRTVARTGPTQCGGDIYRRDTMISDAGETVPAVKMPLVVVCPRESSTLSRSRFLVFATMEILGDNAALFALRFRRRSALVPPLIV